MDEVIDKSNDLGYLEQTELYSKVVRAGKRTYFFDVKSTKRNDFYLTITESKKRFNPDGSPFYEKHKIFLYAEDFSAFTSGLSEVTEYINTIQPELDTSFVKSPPKILKPRLQENSLELENASEFANYNELEK